MTICVVSRDDAASAGISSSSKVTLVASVTSEGSSGDAAAHMRAISPWWSMGMLRGRAAEVKASSITTAATQKGQALMNRKLKANLSAPLHR